MNCGLWGELWKLVRPSLGRLVGCRSSKNKGSESSQRRHMQQSTLSLLMVIGLAIGCGEKPAPSKEIKMTPPPNERVKTEASKLLAPPSDPLAESTSTAPQTQTLEAFSRSTEFTDLNIALNLFHNENKRFPNSVEELKGYTPHGVPRPPQGKQYAINKEKMRVILVDR